MPAAQGAARLRAAAVTKHYRFIDSSLSLLDTTHFDTDRLLGHRQVTDAWLLGLAVANGLRIVSFDNALPMRVARGATPDHWLVI